MPPARAHCPEQEGEQFVTSSQPTVLLIGASRGLGRAMAVEFLKRQWDVVATVRDSADPALADLGTDGPGRLTIERLDITEPDQIAALGNRLSGRRFDDG